MLKVEISEKQFKDAIKRHEESFEKELEEISTNEKELKKIVLKMKKSILEQARTNNSTYNHARNAIDEISGIKNRIVRFEKRMEELEEQNIKCIKSFSESINLIAELKKDLEYEKEKNKPFYIKFLDFIKCLMK